MIKLIDVNKSYKDLQVLKNINIDFPDKGLVTLLGQSGSGKTTLLNVIAGLDKFKGEIIYDNVSIKNYQPIKMGKIRNKNIGYIFQSFNLFEDRTVYDNLQIALELNDIYDKEEQEKRINYCLNAVGMYNYKRRIAKALSGGQQQRVSIARALVKNCKVILADEPTGNLDSKNSIEILNILKKLSKDILVILVTHDDLLAEIYSDKIIQIKDGRIINYLTNESKNTLDIKNLDYIFLKDYEKNSTKFTNLEINEYRKNNEKINLNIISKNGIYYVDSPTKIEILDSNHELEIIDDNYKDIDKESYKKNEFDNKFFDDKKINKSFFKVLKSTYKEANETIKPKKKIKKLTKFAFSLIGLMLAFSMIFKSIQNNKIPENYNIYTKDTYVLEEFDFYYQNDDEINYIGIEKYTTKDNIKDCLLNQNTKISIEFKSFEEVANSFNSVGFLPMKYLEDKSYFNYKYDYDALKNNEVLIDDIIANYLVLDLSEYGIINKDQLINKKLIINNTEFIIKDIVKTNYRNIYINDDNYLELLYEEYKDNEENVPEDVTKEDKQNIIKKYSTTFILNNTKNIKTDDAFYNYYDYLLENGGISGLKFSTSLTTLNIIIIALLCNVIFVMKAMMINDIYDIGIKRVIGSNNKRIILHYTYEAIILALKYSIPQYLFVSFLVFIVNIKLDKTLKVIIGLSINFTFGYFIMGIILLFICYILFSLIPILNLLRKTPTEIITKYDI